MRILFVSNLFPDEMEPVRGLDNATILHSLEAWNMHDIRVISPRPSLLPFVKGKQSRRTPRPEDKCYSPYYPGVGYIPKFGSRWNDVLMEKGLQNSMEEASRKWQPNVVLGSWLFPDGCALSRICKRLRVPLVLITQGSDTHQYLSDPIRKRKIVKAIRNVALVICRSGDLRQQLAEAGVSREKLHVIYNGVDPNLFRPITQESARTKLGIEYENPILLFVGNLLPVKNPHFLLRSFALLNERLIRSGSKAAKLHLIGEGPLKSSLQKEAKRLSIDDDVEFLGRRASDEIALRMNASNIFCLSSKNEGFPNVLLEAMACNLPIVSTAVGGIGERVNAPAIGRLVRKDCIDAYAAALEETLTADQIPSSESAYDGSWRSTAREYEQLLEKACTLSRCKSPSSS